MLGLRREYVHIRSAVRSRRWTSSLPHESAAAYGQFPQSLPSDFAYKIDRAYYDCTESLKQFDRSSELLLHYIPEPARRAYAAAKCFNIEMNKINNFGSSGQMLSRSVGFSAVELKFKFWHDLLYKLSTREVIGGGEPIALLLQDSILGGLQVDLHYLQTFIENRKAHLDRPVFRSCDDICSFGEGTYSQLNYFIQGVLLSPCISPSAISVVESSVRVQELITDIAAHVGQANAVATMIAGVGYYAKRDQITLPLDKLAAHGVSEEQILKLFQGYAGESQETVSQLKDVIFETCVVANDHVLAAKAKFAELKQEIACVVQETDDERLVQQSQHWIGGVPDALYVPFMSVLPIELYLEKLERRDFDVMDRSLPVKDWKLAWKSYRSFNKRSL